MTNCPTVKWQTQKLNYNYISTIFLPQIYFFNSFLCAQLFFNFNFYNFTLFFFCFFVYCACDFLCAQLHALQTGLQLHMAPPAPTYSCQTMLVPQRNNTPYLLQYTICMYLFMQVCMCAHLHTYVCVHLQLQFYIYTLNRKY